jgi:hypothetical protein
MMLTTVVDASNILQVFELKVGEARAAFPLFKAQSIKLDSLFTSLFFSVFAQLFLFLNCSNVHARDTERPSS